MVVGIIGRTNVEFLASKRRVARELNYSRRSFVTTIVGFAALVGLGVALGSVKIHSASSSPAVGRRTAGPTTAITNTSNLQVGSPVYFEYPSGYPNVLFKLSDGTLVAYSMLCTHVCCEVSTSRRQTYSIVPATARSSIPPARSSVGPARSPLPSINTERRQFWERLSHGSKWVYPMLTRVLHRQSGESTIHTLWSGVTRIPIEVDREL